MNINPLPSDISLPISLPTLPTLPTLPVGAVSKSLISLMEKNGITKEKLCKELLEGLNSQKTINVDGELIEVKDYPTVHKYLTTALLLYGELDQAAKNTMIVSQSETHIDKDQLVTIARKVIKDMSRKDGTP